jgi:hypothetical protein
VSDPTKPLRPRAILLLRAFRDAPSHQLTTHEVADVAGFGYSARIGEIRAWLRYRGLGRIDCRPARPGKYVFKLSGPITTAGVGSASKSNLDGEGSAADSGGELGGRSPVQATEPDEPPASPDSARLFDPPKRSMHDREAA